MSTTVEAELDRQIENLVRKIVAGTATDQDLQNMRDLQKVRVNRMRPKLCKKRQVAALEAVY